MPGPLQRFAKPALIFLLAQGLGVLGYLGVERSRSSGTQERFRYEELREVRPAPELALVRPDGAPRRLSEFRGKPVLLHFWATWCPPCREELPELLALGRELSKDGRLELLAVTLDEDWATVREFFGGEVPGEILQDKSQQSMRLYELSTLPDTYLVDSDGLLRLRFGGARDWRGEAVHGLLTRHGNSSH